MWKPSATILKRLRLLASLLAVSGFLFLLPSRFTAPARTLFNEATGPVQVRAFQAAGDAVAAGGTLSEMFLSRDRQRSLEEAVRRLQNENVRLKEEIARQQQHVRSMDGLDVLAEPFTAIRAAVASYDTRATRRSITVRAGARQGVAPGMAVTAAGALAGVVTATGPRQCRVRLLTDIESALPCRFRYEGTACAPRTLFILCGTGGETCRVEWVDRERLVRPGDLLVTASLESVPESGLRLPEGIPAASVLTAKTGGMQSLFYEVEAALLVNLNRLEWVEVLVPAQDP